MGYKQHLATGTVTQWTLLGSSPVTERAKERWRTTAIPIYLQVEMIGSSESQLQNQCE